MCRSDGPNPRLGPDAEPFASSPADASPGSVVEIGGTYEHEVAVPGGYVYACIPHQRSGMIGRISIE